MKTPREILLQKHQAAEVKLDQIRRIVVADLTEWPATRTRPLPMLVVLKLWRELVLPYRRTWAVLAATWLVLALFNVTHAERGQIAAAKSSPPSVEVRIAFQEQQRLLAELIGQTPPAPPAAPSHRPNNQPRSEKRVTLMMG